MTTRRDFLRSAVLAPFFTSWPQLDFSSQANPYALLLGSVQDGGLPQVGCYSERCEAARAGNSARFVSSLAIVEPDEERYYLVDATPDIRHQLDLIDEPGFRRRASERRPFDGIFLTHAHMGHYSGLAQLGKEGLGMAATPCYCTEVMADYLANNGPWSLMVDEGRLELTPLEPNTWHRLSGQMEVRLIPVPHRPEFSDTVGFIFRGPNRSVLYLPDIDRWEDWELGVEEVVESVDVALLDGSFFSPTEVPGRPIEEIPHPMIPHSMDVLQDIVDRNASEVVFTHLNNTNAALDAGSEEEAEVSARGFQVAREPMRWEL